MWFVKEATKNNNSKGFPFLQTKYWSLNLLFVQISNCHKRRSPNISIFEMKIQVQDVSFQFIQTWLLKSEQLFLLQWCSNKILPFRILYDSHGLLPRAKCLKETSLKCSLRVISIGMVLLFVQKYKNNSNKWSFWEEVWAVSGYTNSEGCKSLWGDKRGLLDPRVSGHCFCSEYVSQNESKYNDSILQFDGFRWINRTLKW